jgi:lipopolysaccharide assembly outer membrane protein LptD (OstA)
MRAWLWGAVVAFLLITAASCLDRAPLHRANAQAQAVAPEKLPAPKEEAAASPAKPAAEAEKPAEKTTHEVILEHADRAHYDNKTKEYMLAGDVVLRHEDGVLRAQTLRMNSETKKGVATGDLSFADKQSVVTASRLEIDFDARIAVFKGDVRMVTQKKPENREAKGKAAKPAAGSPTIETQSEGAPAKPAGGAKGESAAKSEAASPATQAKNETQPNQGEEIKPFKEYWEERTEIQCPELEYFYREHRAVAREGITARQKDSTGRADEAEYTDDDQRLVLSGNVEMKNEKGETFRAKKITISIAEDWLEAEGITASRFLVEEEKKAGEEKAAGGAEAKAKGAAPSAPAAETSQPKEKPSQ